MIEETIPDLLSVVTQPIMRNELTPIQDDFEEYEDDFEEDEDDFEEYNDGIQEDIPKDLPLCPPPSPVNCTKPSSKIRENYINDLINEYIQVTGDVYTIEDVMNRFNNFDKNVEIFALKTSINSSKR
tara:strand:+ start:471 stop:851 length:381 start_codon:yes stop_codon:yes gene_type:complete